MLFCYSRILFLIFKIQNQTMEILLWLSALLISLTLLAKSADYFVLYSEKIGLSLGIKDYIIGATIVAFGTSMPELLTSIIGQTEDSTFAVNNIVGSNIANSLLVVGLAAIAAKRLNIKNNVIDIDIPLVLGATALFIIFLLDKTIIFSEAIILLLFFAVYVAYTLSSEGRAEAKEIVSVSMVKKPHFQWQFILFLILSGFGLFLASKGTVTSVFKISEIFNIQSSILTMIVIGLGTSLPEVMVSVKAALKGKGGLAIGNAFGSNIFNITLVGGIPALYNSVTISTSAFTIGIPFLIASSLAVIVASQDDSVSKWEGWGLVILYIAFVGKLTGLV